MSSPGYQPWPETGTKPEGLMPQQLIHQVVTDKMCSDDGNQAKNVMMIVNWANQNVCIVNTNKKGLRQCAKLQDLRGAVDCSCYRTITKSHVTS